MMCRQVAALTLVLAGIGLPVCAWGQSDVSVPSQGQVQVLDCRNAPSATASITGRIVVEAGESIPSAVGLMATATSPVSSCQSGGYGAVAFDWSFTMSRLAAGTYGFSVRADREPWIVATRVVLNGVEKPAGESFVLPDGTSNIVIFVKRREMPPPSFDITLPTAALVSRFKEERWGIQFEIGVELVKRHDPSILASLESWLTHDERRVRGNVAFVFAGLGDPRGFQTIVDILNDRSDRPQPPGSTGRGNGWTLSYQITSDRYYAAHLLGDLRDSRAVPILISLLGDSDVDYIAPWSLGQIGDPRAIPALIGSLDAGSSSTKVLAIYALETLRARDALPRLRSLLTDNARSNFGAGVSVSDAARAAIATITGTAAAP